MSIKCPKCHHENPEDTFYCGKCTTPLKSPEDIEITATIEAPREELTTGSTFAGRYQIIEEIGKGGMGRVYKVQDTKIKEKIALKLIKPEIAKDKKTIERFSNELRLSRKIRHKNVCQMFDLGEERGTQFITMEYVSGEDLRSSIRRFGQLPVGKSISIANQICERSKIADLVVIGHRGLNEEFSTGLLGSTAESITRKCPRPVFVSTKRFKVIERPLLAYDGSQRASAAMESAAEFCSLLQLPLTVLYVAKEEKIAEGILQQAKSYLDSYSVKVTYESTRGYPEQKIIEFLANLNHDLLFIGAYGHRRIIEMVIGGTTEYVLRNTPCPVFLNR